MSQDPANASANILDRFSMKGKVVVATGGARGLGYEMIRGFCQAGATAIGILDVLEDLGAESIGSLKSEFGVQASFYKVDVRDYNAVEQALDSIAKEYGSIDVMLCAAGVVDNIPAEDYPIDKFVRVMEINLNGVYYAARAAGKHMIAQGKGGSVIAIASMSGHIVNWPQPQCAYNASKAAVIQLCKSLATEWAQHRIRVNTISPGYMDTALNKKFNPEMKAQWREKTPQGRLGQMEELNGIALYLASDASTFTTGSDILVDGGYTCW
ncbi:hypothetical protein M407DRAFT_94541 [Tulasnella calospora MUT 4182]|uniref:Uncharacterized protein n=1 Tax=Tulasnella calospora MUT 4182 TaxID=1051891 RepID=A0A0C3QH82_9AGAM|nr:hypothetical protein M407DRAFT_94541 [Tulasnella calospora MUT 4182]